MVDVIIPSNIGVALDIDGTLVDSNRECYQRVCEVWESEYGTDYPLTYEQFHSFRPLVERVSDFFSLSYIFMENDGTMPEDSAEILEAYKNDEHATRMGKEFYKMRDVRKKEDMEGWLADNRVYEGVPEMMQQLGETGWDVFAVTSKDEDSVRKLLDFHGFDGTVKSVYDKETGKGRKEQFTRASEERGVPFDRMVSYDDIPNQLLAAMDLGMTPVAATQGYGDREEIVKHNFTPSLPRDFVERVRFARMRESFRRKYGDI